MSRQTQTADNSPRKRGRVRLIEKRRWIETALKVMAEGGEKAVKVEVLCQNLDVSKGAFYSLFKTRDAFMHELLDYWRQESTEAVIESLSQQHSASAQLEAVLLLPLRRPDVEQRALMEMAIRIWASSNESARATMAEVDSYRLRFFESVLRRNGFDADEAKARAVLIYGYIVIDGSLPGTRAVELQSICRSILSNGS